MSKSFDDILKDGKNVGCAPSTEEVWKDRVSILMFELNRLNGMYNDSMRHNITIEPSNCDKCGKASFLIVASRLDNPKLVTKFFKGDWEPIGSGDKYHCENCKGK